jgi:transcriptional regulator with XRE-family HTH domain
MIPEQFIHYLEAKIKLAGGRAAFAKSHGISQSHLSNIMTGMREPSEQLLKSLDLERIVFYVVRSKLND